MGFGPMASPDDVKAKQQPTAGGFVVVSERASLLHAKTSFHATVPPGLPVEPTQWAQTMKELDEFWHKKMADNKYLGMSLAALKDASCTKAAQATAEIAQDLQSHFAPKIAALIPGSQVHFESALVASGKAKWQEAWFHIRRE
eukprot:NODE_4771_length_752_cov_62.097600_g4748_i0.p1 GENE.NODE_4771_length_752_cov_62.097600_g4748_i0~~NODE_4771_length_752_cov_62.097600_g4748_i0.p1  ORF type:complete len:143 (+),score=33.26 NODE_4771_length_752_cov_62.097600_g4748_i0:74-502(+)